METQIIALNKELLSYQEAYYSGNPIVADSEYDQKERQLLTLVKLHPEFAHTATVLFNVGASKDTAGRILHNRPMKSIENNYTFDSALKACSPYGQYVLVEPKRDGISASILYKHGVLVQAVTRGNGEAGEDMTLQVKACKFIPQVLNAGPVDTLEVRGELVISNSEFARINSELEANGLPLHSNPRNLVSGSMKKRDVSELSNRKIEFVPWDMFSPDDDNILPDSSFIRMSMLTDMGFVKYEGFFVDTISANVEEIIKNILRMNEESDIIADGVVIKADSHEIRNKLNYGTKFSKFQHCYKPQNLSAETEVLDIEWGTGRQGKITPVLLITPTEVGGSIVSRITGNNITWMKELDVKIHSKISFVKSGDTIPMVTEVLDNSEATPIVIPTTCPKCNTPVSIKNDTGIEILLCENSSCSGKAAETFYYVGHRDTLEIDNLGAEMSKYLVNNNITNLADLFEFSNNHLTTSKDQFKNLGFYSGANTVKLVKSLQDAKTRDWDKWIAALSIPFIGHTLGERIAMDLNLQPDDMFNLCDEFLNISVGQIEGLGPVKYNTLLEWAALPQNRLLCDRLSKAGVTPTPITNKEPIMGDLSNITFCITGTFKGTFGTRPVITEKLEALGAKSVPAVTKTCNLLIVGENAGSKLEKAAKLGIKIVDETWLAEVL